MRLTFIGHRIHNLSHFVVTGRHNTALFVHDLVHALVREFRVLGEAVRRNSERRQELLAKEFAWMALMCFFMGSQGAVSDLDVVGALIQSTCANRAIAAARFSRRTGLER